MRILLNKSGLVKLVRVVNERVGAGDGAENKRGQDENPAPFLKSNIL